MDGVKLLRAARWVGLAVQAEGGTLRIRGPRRAKGAALALLKHKAAILAVLAAELRGELAADGNAGNTACDARCEPIPLGDGPPVETPSGYLCPADLPEPWRELYEERAAIRQFEGGQAREHAEAGALKEILQRMTECS